MNQACLLILFLASLTAGDCLDCLRALPSPAMLPCSCLFRSMNRVYITPYVDI